MGTYIDTSGIVDGTTIDAADVKTPLDALDAALAALAAAPFIVDTLSSVLSGESTLGAAIVGVLGGGATIPTIYITGAAGTNRDVFWRSDANLRWLMRVNSTAEGGADAGSNFEFYRISDAGAATLNWTIVRSSGAWTISGAVSHPEPVTVITGDGAITIASGLVALTKGSAAAITLAAPTAGTHDGTVIRVYSETAFAHVITSGTDGFNAKGSSGTCTFAAAKGNGVLLEARNGHWWVLTNSGVTVA